MDGAIICPYGRAVRTWPSSWLYRPASVRISFVHHYEYVVADCRPQQFITTTITTTTPAGSALDRPPHRQMHGSPAGSPQLPAQTITHG